MPGFFQHCHHYDTLLQEMHHYTHTEYSFNTLEAIHRRDAMKKEQALSKGITLIIIPCWWDRTRSR